MPGPDDSVTEAECLLSPGNWNLRPHGGCPQENPGAKSISWAFLATTCHMCCLNSVLEEQSITCVTPQGGLLKPTPGFAWTLPQARLPFADLDLFPVAEINFSCMIIC